MSSHRLSRSYGDPDEVPNEHYQPDPGQPGNIAGPCGGNIGFYHCYLPEYAGPSETRRSLAADVVRGGYELNYLADDYLINAGPRARDQWEERYASLQPIISQLKASNQEEAHSIEAIRDYNAKIGQMFREIPGPGELEFMALPCSSPASSR